MRYKIDKKAKDLVFNPLFERLEKAIERVTKQTTSFILRSLNNKFMQNPDVVNGIHAFKIIALGIKNNFCDSDFSWAIIELLNNHGVAILHESKSITKAIQHFI